MFRVEKTRVIPSGVEFAQRTERSRGNEVSLSIFFQNKQAISQSIPARELRERWDYLRVSSTALRSGRNDTRFFNAAFISTETPLCHIKEGDITRMNR